MSGPPQLSDEIKIPKKRDLPSKVHSFTGDDVIDFLLLTVTDCEFLSCILYLQEPLKYHSKGLGYVYVGKMGGEDEGKKLTVALIKCDMGSGVGGSAMAVKDAVTKLRPKGVFCVGFCGGMNIKEAKLGDVVVSKRLISYAFVKVTKDRVEPRGTNVPLSKNINDIIRYAGYGWKPPLKNIEEAGEVVSGMMLSGPELVNDVTRRNELLTVYPKAIAIEMEGEGVYTAAHDLKIEWAVIKGISDYADGTKADTEDWQPYASLMAASVVAHILSSPMVFEDWPHYEGAPGGTVQPTKRLLSGSDSGNKVDPGTVIAGTELTIGLLKDVLDVLDNVDRKVAIGIDNESTFQWQEPSTYFVSGTADKNLPFEVNYGQAVLYGPRKTKGPVATGVVGVFTYYIPSKDKTLAVLWSVPFDYNWYENWWNIHLYNGNKKADYDMYKELYYDIYPFQANDWHKKDLGSGLKSRGSMSSSGKATLEIYVSM